jgi:hypothetical protein
MKNVFLKNNGQIADYLAFTMLILVVGAGDSDPLPPALSVLPAQP